MKLNISDQIDFMLKNKLKIKIMLKYQQFFED